jgi:hypothetical protein
MQRSFWSWDPVPEIDELASVEICDNVYDATVLKPHEQA